MDLALASLRCFAFVRACSPFLVFDLPPRQLGVNDKAYSEL